MDYDGYKSQLQNLMAISSASGDYASFQIFLPGCIDYAEQRMYRELDLLATRVADATTNASSGVRNFYLPTTTGTYLVVEQVNVLTPVGATAANGIRQPVTMVSRPFVDACYPSAGISTGIPEFAALDTNTHLVFGPAPDRSYTVEVIGTQRPTPLSSSNTTTILTTMLPDVFIAASMVFAMGYQRNFGSQAGDPAASQSWESQYQTLKNSANVEELRKKYQSQGWTSQQPSPIATPERV